jgi:hypothetical protein
MDEIIAAIPLTQLNSLLGTEPQRLLPMPASSSYPAAVTQQMAACTTHLTSWSLTAGDEYIHLQTSPVHPLKDIDTHTHMQYGGFALQTATDSVDIHDSVGRYLTTLQNNVYEKLRADHASLTRDTPTTPGDLTVDEFMPQLIMLLYRHKLTYQHPKLPRKCLHDDGILTLLIDTFELTKQRFTTPTRRHPNIRTYWSEHAADSCLGAMHDTYSVPFWGASLATPPETPEAIHKALTWAILSCYNDAPSLTVMLIPNYQRAAGYKALLSHAFVSNLCTITPAPLPLEGGRCAEQPARLDGDAT